MAAAGLAVLIGAAALRIAQPDLLTYSPYPPDTLWPDFRPWIGLLCCLGGVPGLVALATGTGAAEFSAPLEERP